MDLVVGFLSWLMNNNFVLFNYDMVYYIEIELLCDILIMILCIMLDLKGRLGVLCLKIEELMVFVGILGLSLFVMIVGDIVY